MSETNNALTLKFYNTVIDDFLLFAVIIAKFDNKWLLCKHRNRNTFEFPGGKREKGESIIDTAKRELYEETGAITYKLEPFMPYSITERGVQSFGMIYYANIEKMNSLPASEIESIVLVEDISDIEKWTYPTIMPLMFEEYKKAKL